MACFQFLASLMLCRGWYGRRNRCSLCCQLNQLYAFASIILLIITLSQRCSDSKRNRRRKRERNANEFTPTQPTTHTSCELMARCSDLHSEIMDTKSNAPYCERHSMPSSALQRFIWRCVLCHLLIHIYFMVKIIEVFRFH